MLWMPHRGLRPLVDGGQPHAGHEAPHALVPDLMSPPAKMAHHLLRAGPKRLEELAVDRSHDGEGFEAFGPQAAVEGRPTDADQGALARDQQLRVIRFDHLPSRPHAQRPEARRKKSRSTTS